MVNVIPSTKLTTFSIIFELTVQGIDTTGRDGKICQDNDTFILLPTGDVLLCVVQEVDPGPVQVIF